MKSLILTSAIIVAALLANITGSAQKIRTIAGTGSIGYSGDGGQAVHAMVGGSWGIALDGNGDLFFADDDNNVIRKIAPSGVITTIAGTATPGYSGDGGPATAARLNYPSGIATDGHGNLYIADNGNYVIRKIDATGTITTVAGNGTWGYSGDGGPAVSARLNGCVAMAFDRAGNMYIADGNTRIRKVNTTGTISTVAGGSMWGYSGDGGAAVGAALAGPCGIAIDTLGNIYFSDQPNNVIRKVNTSGIISTIAGTNVGGFSGDFGAATDAKINTPAGVTIDNEGNVYFADQGNNRIRKINASGTISTIAGNGIYGYTGDDGFAANASMKAPSAVCMNSTGNMFITDRSNYAIREVINAATISIGAAPSNIITDGTTVTFTAPANTQAYGLAYQWQLNGVNVGTNSTTYTNNSLNSGDVVTCTMIDPAGGSSFLTSNEIVMINNSYLSTPELVTNNSSIDINLYPNPNNGTFQLSGTFTSNKTEYVNYSVFDMAGKVLYQNATAPNKGQIAETINLGRTLPTGQYILRASSENAQKDIHFEINN